MKLYIDTNIFLALKETPNLLHTIQEQLPEYRLATLPQIVNELEIRSHGASKDAQTARLALTIIQKQDLKIPIQTQYYADTALLEAMQPKDALLSLDKELQKRAIAKGCAVFTIRKQRAHLIKEGTCITK